jgi:two-component sensor histidine kinase
VIARAFLETHKVHPKAVYAMHLALEELISNTIRYGYDDNLLHAIYVSTCVVSSEILLTIMDDGRPFNPLSMHGSQINGFGLQMVFNAVDVLDYKWIGQRNILMIRIKNPQ